MVTVEAVSYTHLDVYKRQHQFSLRLREYAALNHRECSGEREELEIQYATVSTVTDPGADLSVLMNQLRAHMESHRERCV